MLVILSSPRRNTLRHFPRAFAVLEFSFQGSRRPAARGVPRRLTISDNLRSEVVRSPKIYFADNGVRNAAIGDFAAGR